MASSARGGLAVLGQRPECKQSSQGVRGESNPSPRLSQSRMLAAYTTDTINRTSSPGWNRTTVLPHVTGTSCRWTTGLCSTPTRSRTRNASFEARHDLRFTTGVTSGRQGIRTLSPPEGTRRSRPARRTVSGYLPLSGAGGSRTRICWMPSSRLPAGPQPRRVERRGVAPRSLACKASVFLLDERPSSEVRPGLEPGLPPYQRGVPPHNTCRPFSDPGWARTITHLDVTQGPCQVRRRDRLQ